MTAGPWVYHTVNTLPDERRSVCNGPIYTNLTIRSLTTEHYTSYIRYCVQIVQTCRTQSRRWCMWFHFRILKR